MLIAQYTEVMMLEDIATAAAIAVEGMAAEAMAAEAIERGAVHSRVFYPRSED